MVAGVVLERVRLVTGIDERERFSLEVEGRNRFAFEVGGIEHCSERERDDVPSRLISFLSFRISVRISERILFESIAKL